MKDRRPPQPTLSYLNHLYGQRGDAGMSRKKRKASTLQGEKGDALKIEVASEERSSKRSKTEAESKVSFNGDKIRDLSTTMTKASTRDGDSAKDDGRAGGMCDSEGVTAQSTNRLRQASRRPEAYATKLRMVLALSDGRTRNQSVRLIIRPAMRRIDPV